MIVKKTEVLFILKEISKIIWQSKDSRITISDHNDGTNPHYQIHRATTKDTRQDIWIDHDERVCKALIKKMNNYYLVSNKKNFNIISKKHGSKISLRRWLWQQYHPQKKLSKYAKIELADGDMYNMLSYNLASTRDNCPNNNVRRIWRQGEYLNVSVRSKGNPLCFDVTLTTEYDQELYDLLCDYRLRWTFDNKKKYAVANYFWYTGKLSLASIYFHQIVYGFHYFRLRKNNVLNQLREMRAFFQKENLVIDHLDSDTLNNCKYNLSVMTRAQNSRKSDLTSKIVKPYFFFAAYDGQVYKIFCGIERQDKLDGKHYICKNADALIDLVKTFLKSKEFDEKTPEEVFKANPNNQCLAQYFITAHSRRKDTVNETYSVKDYHRVLAEIPEENFQICKI
jgi:hypothetical protein